LAHDCQAAIRPPAHVPAHLFHRLKAGRGTEMTKMVGRHVNADPFRDDRGDLVGDGILTFDAPTLCHKEEAVRTCIGVEVLSADTSAGGGDLYRIRSCDEFERNQCMIAYMRPGLVILSWAGLVPYLDESAGLRRGRPGLPVAKGSPRPKESRHCRRSIGPDHRLSHAGRRYLLPRSRKQLLCSPRPRPYCGDTAKDYLAGQCAANRQCGR